MLKHFVPLDRALHFLTFCSKPTGEESAAASPLLQALNVQQEPVESLDGNSKIPKPLRKYYLNLGKLLHD